MARRPIFEFTIPRMIAAGSFFVVAGYFAVAVVEFLEAGHKNSSGLRSLADWPMYEFLASAFGILLPFVGMVRQLVGRLGLSWQKRWAVITVMWLPFFLVAWILGGSDFWTKWFIVGFLVFALVHVVSFECDETRQARLDSPRNPLRRSLLRFTKCYGTAMLAAGIAMFTVFGAMDVMGIFLESEARLRFMSVTVGVFYFLLLGVGELIDVDGRIDSVLQRRIDDRQRDLEWTRRALLGGELLGGEPSAKTHPDPPPGTGRFAPPEELAGGGLATDLLRIEAFEDWVEEFPVSGEARKRIQYWDRKLVRFGKPLRIVRRDRTLCLAVAVLAFLGSIATLFASLHPDSFKKKHATGAPTNYSEQDDRNAMMGMSVFGFLLGVGMSFAYRHHRRDELGSPRATIDCYNRLVTGPEGEMAKLRHCRLVVEDCETPAGSRIVAAKLLRAVPSGPDGTSVTLLEGVSLRDAELVRGELLGCGFDASTPAPKATPHTPWEVTLR